MSRGTLVAGFLVALVVAVVVVGIAKRAAERASLLDAPNDRSSHRFPVPRIGGIGIVAGIGAGLAFSGSLGSFIPAFSGAVLMALVGLWDDVRPLRASVRFLAQLVVCVGFLCAQELSPTLVLPTAEFALANFFPLLGVLWLMWMVNLYNFMDGIDGFAGSQALAFAAFLALASPTIETKQMGVAVGGAALGFLFWNWPPAKVFMGDVGSTALGFLFGAVALQAQPGLPLPGVYLVMLPFIFDATFTLVRRALEGRKVWQAHRSHLYQLPQAWGVANETVLLVESLALAVQLGLALVYVWTDEAALRWLILAASTCAMALVAMLVFRRAKLASKEIRW